LEWEAETVNASIDRRNWQQGYADQVAESFMASAKKWRPRYAKLGEVRNAAIAALVTGSVSLLKPTLRALSLNLRNVLFVVVFIDGQSRIGMVRDNKSSFVPISV